MSGAQKRLLHLKQARDDSAQECHSEGIAPSLCRKRVNNKVLPIIIVCTAVVVQVGVCFPRRLIVPLFFFIRRWIWTPK